MPEDKKGRSENEQAGAAQGEAEASRGTLRLRQENAKTSYTNFAMVTSTPEEVILNFGLNVMPPNQERQMNIEISDRVIMSYVSAKRLAIALSNVIQRYEAVRGVIQVGPQQPAQSQAEAQIPKPEAEA